MTRLPPTPQTIKKLFALSGNLCAFPGCSQSLVDEEGNLVANICHIEAAEPEGERYDVAQTDEERRSIENLILFCPTHHTITDNVKKYTVSVLKEIKASHEGKFLFRAYIPTDKVLEQAISKYIQLDIKQFNNAGKGVQINQVGLDYVQARQLFIDLLDLNFPRLKAAAEEIARARVEELRDRFFHMGQSNLASEDLGSFADPDAQFILTQAVETAARSASSNTRSILALLLNRRIKNTAFERRKLIYNAAIQTVSKLTANHIRILSLHFLLYDYLRVLEIQSWKDLDYYYNKKVFPLLEFENNYVDFTHLAYSGCCSLETSFGPTSYAQITKNRFRFLFPQLTGSRGGEQEYIESEMKTNLQLGSTLIELWSNSYIWALNLTAVGYVIAETGYEVLTQDYNTVVFGVSGG